MQPAGTQKDVVGFGALNIDILVEGVSLEDVSTLVGREIVPDSEGVYSTDSFPDVWDLMTQKGRIVGKSGGGSAANTVDALAKLGFTAGYVGRVGTDGDFLLDGLQNVDRSRVVRETGKSGCVIALQYGDQRAMLIYPNANDNLKTSDIDPSALDARFVHMTSFVGHNPYLAQTLLAQRLPEGSRLSFDPGMLYAKARGIRGLKQILQETHVLFVNEQELYEITKEDSVKKGLEKMLSLDYGCCQGGGPMIVACKRGNKGSVVRDIDGNYVIAEAEPVSASLARYPVGTGDAYDAGFLAGLLMGKDLQTCATYGNHLGAQKIQVPREKFVPQLPAD